MNAERRAGELLKGMDLKPGRKSGIGNTGLPKEVSKIQSSRWQTMTAVPAARVLEVEIADEGLAAMMAGSETRENWVHAGPSL